MSNTQVHVIEIDEVKLAYVNDEGSGTPLFLMSSLADAFGLDPASGYFYKEDLKAHRVKRKLNPKTKKVTCIHLDGVYKLLEWRKPVWEQGFREQFVLFQEESSRNLVKPREDNTPYNPQKPAGQGTIILDVINKLDRQGKVIDRLCEAVEKLQAQSGPCFLDVPRRALRVYPPVGAATGAVGDQRALDDEPIYTHVPGYRTYKELLADHGLDEYINTRAGRAFSFKLSRACASNGIRYYLVVDSYRVARSKHKTLSVTGMDTCAINAYPQEIWDVVGKRLAQEMLDTATIE